MLIPLPLEPEYSRDGSPLVLGVRGASFLNRIARVIRVLAIKVRRIRLRNSSNAPWMSGNSFAGLVDYTPFGVGGKEPFNSQLSSKADSIFIVSDRLEEYLQLVRKLGHSPRVIITGNSDRNFVAQTELPGCVKLWLCQNNAMPASPKILTLPIGIENIQLGRMGIPRLFRSASDSARVDSILVPPMSPTNPERRENVLRALGNPKVFHVQLEYLPEKKYLQLTRSYKFVLCLEGNGFENHRIWETLYQGSFPVLIRSPWSESLMYLQLPMLFIDSIGQVTQADLERFEKLNREFKPISRPELWTPFWAELIRRAIAQEPR